MTDDPHDEPLTVRVVVPLALAVGAAYLTWRAGWTRDGTNGWLFWVLWAAELTIWISLLHFAFETWTLRSDDPEPCTQQRTVDVIVICKDEPIEVLRATLLGCNSLRGPHRTVAVDTCARTDLAELTAGIGIEHMLIRRSDPTTPAELHLNTVLERLDGDLVAMLRGDDVPLPTMLDTLCGFFDDDEVWLAQGRQAVYGRSAGEYGGSSDELGLFFGVIEAGKNHHGAALWCGSGGVLRRSALDSLGGVPLSTDTPAFELSLAARESGWCSRYTTAPVALTLARPDVEGYVARRTSFAAGHLQSLRTRHSPSVRLRAQRLTTTVVPRDDGPLPGWAPTAGVHGCAHRHSAHRGAAVERRSSAARGSLGPVARVLRARPPNAGTRP